MLVTVFSKNSDVGCFILAQPTSLSPSPAPTSFFRRKGGADGGESRGVFLAQRSPPKPQKPRPPPLPTLEQLRLILPAKPWAPPPPPPLPPDIHRRSRRRRRKRRRREIERLVSFFHALTYGLMAGGRWREAPLEKDRTELKYQTNGKEKGIVSD